MKAVQRARARAKLTARMEERGSWQTRITPDLAAFIEAQTSIFLATANVKGSPTSSIAAGRLAFSGARRQDHRLRRFSGNRQYITLGNLADNPKAHLFLIDYAHRRRIKIWGEARVVEGDAS